MRKRLDILLFEKGMVDTRSKAQALIMAGQVLVDGKKETKAGARFEEDVAPEVLEVFPYVGRGAEKLKRAHEDFKIDFKNKVVADIGSSTGGFTDYALQNGAKKVYAVDVGTGQLHWRLRNDPRVVVMEKTDFRDVKGFEDGIDIFVIDVSFISARKILDSIKYKVLSIKENTEIIVLFKPQFEAGKKIADKFRGVITDENIHLQLLEEFREWCQKEGFDVLGETESPIKGDKGNREFLLWLKLK